MLRRVQVLCRLECCERWPSGWVPLAPVFAGAFRRMIMRSLCARAPPHADAAPGVALRAVFAGRGATYKGGKEDARCIHFA